MFVSDEDLQDAYDFWIGQMKRFLFLRGINVPAWERAAFMREWQEFLTDIGGEG